MVFLWQGFTHIIQVNEINHWRCFAGCCSRGKEKIVNPSEKTEDEEGQVKPIRPEERNPKKINH